MRREINLIESFLSEINMIPDFDDTLNAIRKDNTWGEMVAKSKTVGRIGSLTVLVYHSDFGDMYFLMDGKSPVGKATVSETTFSGFYKVGHIWFEPAYRGKGHGYALYEYLLNKGMKLVSDIDQTRFSRGVWSKLARNGYVHAFGQGGRIGEIVTDTEPFYDGASSRMVAVKSLNEGVSVNVDGNNFNVGSGSFKYGSTAPSTSYSTPYSSTPASSSDALASLIEEARRYLSPKNLTWLLDCKIVVARINDEGLYRVSTDTVTLHPNYIDLGTLMHELGHRFHYRCYDDDAFDDELWEKYQYFKEYDHSAFWRAYGKSSRFEFWADSFEYWILNDMHGAPHEAWISSMINKYNRGHLNEGATINVDGNTYNVGGGSSYNYAGSKGSVSVGPSAPRGAKYRASSERVLFNSALSDDERDTFREALSDAKQILNAKGMDWLGRCTFSFGSETALAKYHANTDTVRLRWGNYDNSVSRICDTILHELGHRFHYQCNDHYAFDRELAAKYKYYLANDHDVFMREYGRKDRFEFWADCFNLWVTNRIHNYDHAVWVSDMIEKYNRY